MGQEYIVHLRESDLQSIRRNPFGPNTVDALLQKIPCYVGRSEDGAVFFYSVDKVTEGRWPSNISKEEQRLVICAYDSGDLRCIRTFLFDQLMDICGRFEIEDA